MKRYVYTGKTDRRGEQFFKASITFRLGYREMVNAILDEMFYKDEEERLGILRSLTRGYVLKITRDGFYDYGCDASPSEGERDLDNWSVEYTGPDCEPQQDSYTKWCAAVELKLAELFPELEKIDLPEDASCNATD